MSEFIITYLECDRSAHIRVTANEDGLLLENYFPAHPYLKTQPTVGGIIGEIPWEWIEKQKVENFYGN